MRRVVLLSLVAISACAGAPEPLPVPAPAPPPPVAVAPPPAPAPTASEPAAPPPPPAPVASSAPPETPEPDAGPAAPACPDDTVWVPPTGAQGFLMGKGMKNAHRVVLTHGFCMEANEVTVRAYAKCVEAGACKEPWKGDPYSTYPLHLDYPVDLVSYPKARAYCAWMGRRLPTEAEWEWAATGPDQTTYPWGNEPEPSCDYVDYTKFGAPKWEAGGDIGCGGGGPSPVDTHPKGDKIWPGGAIHDLAGNVWEWIEDSYAPYSPKPATDPVVRKGASVFVIRGGGWNRSYAAMVVTYRGAADVGYQVPALGLRCVRGEPLPEPSPRHE